VIRLLAVDIDGTLLDSRGHLPETHREAVAEAHRRGIEIALVTGRSAHFALPVASAVGVPLTLVVNNGAVVKDASGATRLRHLLPRATAREILSGMRAYEDSVAIVFDRAAADAERQIVFERMDWTHPNRRRYYERNRPFIAAADGPLAEALDEDPIQVMFNGHVAPMRALAADLAALPAARRFSVALTEYESRDFAMVDVNGPGCSKGTTLARWTAIRAFAPAEVMAVGDNLNDLEMLEFAGVAVVMGNGTDALRAKLRRPYHVTAGNDEGGLARAIAEHALTEG
jgi:Cof subfamily protein (haloacid dehalogenase superfamily)